MSQPLSLLLVDADPAGLETLTYGFEREGSNVNATSDLMAAPQLVGAAAPSLVVVTLRPPEPAALEVIRLLRTGGHAIPHVAVLALGPSERKAEARTAGASEFLTTPTFIRDVVNAGKLALVGRRSSGQDAPQTQTRLSDYQGLFYLLRAMAAAQSSAVVRLERGSRRAELRVSEGRLLSANVDALQGLPALHHVLLWEEAGVSLKLGSVPKRSQLNLLAQEVLDESERFLRDFAHAARDLGPSSTVFVPASSSSAGPSSGLQTSQIAPLLRLCDGHRVLADVIAESPFRIFDTVRMLKRLRDGGRLSAHVPEPQPTRHPGHNGTPRSMLGEWAMVPDLRGVVGDRRGPNREPRQAAAPATPGPTPLPLVNRKGVATAGEILPKRRPTPAGAGDLAVAPTIQVKLDAHGVPLSAPQALAPAELATVEGLPGQKTPILLRTRADQAARSRLDHTPPPEVRTFPTGPQPSLEQAPPPQAKRSPTGPQPSLEQAPPRTGQEVSDRPTIQSRAHPRLPAEKVPDRPTPQARAHPRPPAEKAPERPTPQARAHPRPPAEKAPERPTPDARHHLRRRRVGLLRQGSRPLQTRGGRDLRRSRSPARARAGEAARAQEVGCPHPRLRNNFAAKILRSFELVRWT